MPRRKARKAPYQPPINEQLNRRERVSRPARQRPAPGPRGARPIEPPSIRRVVRRVPLVFGAFVVLQLILPSSKLEGLDKLPAALLMGALMTVVFIPMSLLMDRIIYRGYLKRVAAREEREE